MKIKSVDMKECGTGEITMEYAEKVFQELLAFQGYGFCLGYDAVVTEISKGDMPIGRLCLGDRILAPGDEKGDAWVEVVNVMPQGMKELFEVTFDNGTVIHSTLDHRMLCSDGEMRTVLDVFNGRHGVSCHPFAGKCLSFSSISGIVSMGVLPCMDISVKSRRHLFYANGLVVSNCKAHAVSYSVYSAVQMWLQEHYFIEYMCALLNHIDRSKEKKGHLILDERVEYCIRHGMGIQYPDVNRSSDKWEIDTGATLLAPLKNIKGFSDKDVANIVSNRPYADFSDFLAKTKMSGNKLEAILFSNALRSFGTIEDLYNWYKNEYLPSLEKKPKKDTIMNLFGDDEEESSSASAKQIVTFTKDELEEKCLDINGFVVRENILIQYHDYFENGMRLVAEKTRNNDYIGKTSKIYTLGQILASEAPEDGKYRNFWTLAKVQNVARGLKSKFSGGTFGKMTVGDGHDSITITSKSIPDFFQKNNVVIFPVSVSDTGKVYLDSRILDKLEPVVLE